MKLETFLVEAGISRRMRGLALSAVIPIGLLLGASVHAQTLVTWSDGQTLTSADLNGNFQYVLGQSLSASASCNLKGSGSSLTYEGVILDGNSNLCSDYAVASSPKDSNLYINRPDGGQINFSEGANAPEVTIETGGSVQLAQQLTVHDNSGATDALRVSSGNVDITSGALSLAGNPVLESQSCGGVDCFIGCTTNTYTGLVLNGAAGLCSGSTNNFSIASGSVDQTLYLNRPSGAYINFQESGTGDELVITPISNGGIVNAIYGFNAPLLDVAGSTYANTQSCNFGQGAGTQTYTGTYVDGSATCSDFAIASSSADKNLYINRPTGSNIDFVEGGGTDNEVDIQAGGTVQIAQNIVVHNNTSANHPFAAVFDSEISATSYVTASDSRLKHDVTTLSDSLQKIQALRGVNYVLNSDATNKRQIGVIAQEVEAQFPEVVVTGEDGFKAVAYDRLVAPLIEAVKEQQAEIEELRRDNAELRRSLAKRPESATEARLARLEKLVAAQDAASRRSGNK